MKVLIFNEFYYPNIKGGAEISTQLLAEQLVKMNVDVSVCTLSDNGHTESINGVNVYYMKYRNLYWEFSYQNPSTFKRLAWHLIDSNNVLMYKPIIDVIKKVKPDIIHTNNICGFSTIIWSIAHKLNIPVIHTLRDYYLMCPKTTMFNNDKECITQCKKCALCSSFHKRNSKYVDAVVGISKFILNKHLENNYFQNAIKKQVIYNPVDIQCDTSKVHDEKKIGFLGTLAPHKGIEYLLKNFISLGNKDYQLVIGGTGNPKYLTYLKNKYSYSNVHFLGRVESKSFLSSIGMLVVPSLWNEPFGRVVAEGQTCGCVVTTSNKGGLPELIEDKRLVFSIDNDCELQNILLSYMNKSEMFTSKKCHDFTTLGNAQSYYDIYKCL